MFLTAETSGHPRDMGLDQGHGLGAAIRERVGRAGLPLRRSRLPSLAAFASGPVRGTGTAREMIRHYPHLAERIDGLARGAAVPIDSIFALHATTNSLGSGDLETRSAVAIAALGLEDSPGVTLARSLPGSADPGSTVVVRRSRPAVGFESVDVTLPWLVTSLCGMNEAGLAACFVSGHPGPVDVRHGAVPILLVQESLQRFESVDASIDWACSRPVAGWGTLLLADANGSRASVVFAGSERVATRVISGPLVAGHPERIVDALREAAAGERVLDEKALCPPDDSSYTPAWVRMIPTRRTLELRRPIGPREELLIQV
jgi:hypothetical protein